MTNAKNFSHMGARHGHFHGKGKHHISDEKTIMSQYDGGRPNRAQRRAMERLKKKEGK